ncbi:HupE/UreJ family protein [Rheinheimera riviphila]|uniref:HupE/UreJ family protein n=1 Tax=Rheinheimera riviphila TaxID=1834037 RepID=A0A437QR92_9GAMM|nr:HupE/UreJ family protein [Rheinheimera riviphila]RVU37033.1 HupE/UreJ family protein [Rheinheimera riviphila]
MLFKGSAFKNKLLWLFTLLWLGLCTTSAFGHGVEAGDQAFIEQAKGLQLLPFIYLGAKHMVTGYDHLLFLAAVMFFLYRMKDIALYVTLFAVGHSLTLLGGVLSGFHVNPYLVDALIGLSIVYKALDNMQAFESWLGKRPDPKLMVWLFGLVHGFGLASKVQDFSLEPLGLVGNMLAFNVGVELGQLLALGLILILMNFWRLRPSFQHHAFRSNQLLMTAGFVFFFYQMTGLFLVA